VFVIAAVTFVVSSTRTAGAAGQQGGGSSQLAEERFKNIQIFKGKPSSGVIPAMRFFATSLGVECNFCHVRGAMDKDDKKEKVFARKMYEIAQFANKEIGEPEVTCYTCHRGHQEPQMPADMSKAQVEAMIKAGDEKDPKPAETVFKNIQILKGTPAGRVMVYMRLFTKDLGVKCDFCHAQGGFDKDDNPKKATARKMLAMVGGIARQYTNGEIVINCYTCHQGQQEPPGMPPASAPSEK
jgi:hypothetical protein